LTRKHLFQCIALGLCLILTTFGCDQLKDIKNKITGDEKPVEKPVKPRPAPEAVAAKPKVPEMTPDTLARVGTWSITKKEFNERLAALKEVLPEFDITDLQNRKDVLEELIRQQLIVIDAEKTGFVNNSDIKAAVE